MPTPEEEQTRQEIAEVLRSPYYHAEASLEEIATRLQVQSKEAMAALVSNVLLSLPPAVHPKPPLSRRERMIRRLEAKRDRAMQRLHDRLFPTGAYCCEGC